MRALLMLPPFGGLDRPSLGVHTVQAVARARGHAVDVYYSNIEFAVHIGEIAYMVITTFGTLDLLGERIMGLPLGASIPAGMMGALNRRIAQAAQERGVIATLLTLQSLRDSIDKWLEDVLSVAIAGQYDVIGFSTTFEQTNGVALLARACRSRLPEVRLVVGGANCDGPMAPAMQRFVPEIDVVFSGESEDAFATYLDCPDQHIGRAIVSSPPTLNLDIVPPPDYREFFEQFDRKLPGSTLRRDGELKVSYETSRGCWWGQKHHCTFCGLNGGGMGYREKSPEKVIRELQALTGHTQIRRVEMTDNIMPHSYFSTLIPMLAEADLGLDIFYEQKANISLEKILALRAAGVSRIQPGIEALSDDLLLLMRKGTSKKQNIALLRYARSCDLTVDWNLLSGFPGDREEWYQETLDSLPSLVHLPPPTGFYALNFDRFSPYFEQADRYGIEDLTPAPSYVEAFPTCDYLPDLAYHFQGKSNGFTMDKSETLRRLNSAVEVWRSRWDTPGGTPPCLEVVDLGSDEYILIDTRGLPGSFIMQPITADQASVALSFHTEEGPATRWGEEYHVCLRGRGGFSPLACASPKILDRFERVSAPDLADVIV
jgi:ribosomal peptide maturation radical SAM protein 1